MVRVLLSFLSLLSPSANLSDCVSFWQNALELCDWTIRVEVVPQRALEAGTVGDITPDSMTRTAVLRVMRASDSDLSGRMAGAEQQFTIVHEMVHLQQFTRGDAGWANEMATNAAAARLVREHNRRFEMMAVEDRSGW